MSTDPQTLEEPVVAVMVAAGSGTRLGADQPKALVWLDGVPLVRRAIDALAAGGVTHVVVAVPPDHVQAFSDALTGSSLQVQLVSGGSRRQDSVRLGVRALEGFGPRAIVLVHDAARPLVPKQVVQAVVQAVREGADAVVPVIPVTDSIRAVIDGLSRVVDRSALRAVQTPQGFRLETLMRAHESIEARALEVTDDAAAAEAVGLSVAVVPGHRDALKITDPLDLALAEVILRAREEA